MTYTEPPTEAMRPVPPPRRRSHGLLWAVTGLAVLVAAGAVLVVLGVVPNPVRHPASPTPDVAPVQATGTVANPLGNFTIAGSITIIGAAGQDYEVTDGGQCVGTGGYSDISPGVAVTVGDSTGKTLAIGSITLGESAPGQCLFVWAVKGVPFGLSEYTVTISHRGTQVLTQDQAQQPVDLTLGG